MDRTPGYELGNEGSTPSRRTISRSPSHGIRIRHQFTFPVRVGAKFAPRDNRMSNHRNNNRLYTTPCCHFVWDVMEYPTGPVVWDIIERAAVCNECARRYEPSFGHSYKAGSGRGCDGLGGVFTHVYQEVERLFAA